ncbi:Eco57I restriction-modification methylase domain-containing protein [Psychrobacter celer]|uniref:Eco57I restriction-modification methylase domain-containing protein n=3 Tax=Psychrobacter TaxID=497 RepID=UPI003FD5A9FA
MAFDQTTRNRLQRFVNSAREILSDEFTRQLQAVYGMDPKQGTVADISSLTHLNNSERQTAHILRETLEHYLATTPGKSDKDRVKQVLSRIVREQAFTVLNRLAALRMAEARDFLLESVGKGQSSKGFQLYRQLAGTSHGETGDAYRNYLFSLFDEFSIDLAVLFDRYSTQGRLFPRESALLELLAEINHHEIEELWAEDETIGWIYQYFNSQEERKKMRAESQAPRNSRELAVRNQFFTPRYVVEFLTDNTLGRIWYEMTQGNTALIDSCSYLVRRPNEIFLKPDEQSPETGSVESESLSQDELLKQPVYIPYRKLKDPRSIHMLDPACGSMHFGLYAFDLYEQIYLEAWQLEQELGPDAFQREANQQALQTSFANLDEFKAQIPKLIIENNIHGVDIDPRAVQIAGLSLWQRAQRAWQQQGVKPQQRPVIVKSNIVCAEPMPGDKDLLKEFTGKLHPPALGQLVEVIFDKMELAGEAGTLLKIEEEIQTAIDEARDQWETKKGSDSIGDLFQDELEAATPQHELGFDLYGIDNETFWDDAEQLILKALSDYADRAEFDTDQKRLFAEDAAKGFAFIDLCRKRFDVVLMNPPFGEPASSTRQLFKRLYPTASDNVAIAFMERGSNLTTPMGLSGSITDCSWAKRLDYCRFRELILSQSGLQALVQLGWGVLDNANVETNLTVLGTTSSLAFTLDVSDVKSKAEMISHSALGNSSQSFFPFHKFSYLPNSVFAFEMKLEEFDAYAERSFVSKSIMKAVAGVKSCNSNADFRVWWEVSCSQLGPKRDWQLLHNGSPYCPFHYPAFFVVRVDEGSWTQLMANGGARPGEVYYGQSGIAYGKRTGSMYGYIKPKDQVFSQEGQAIFPVGTVSPWAALALTNSSIFSRHANYVAGQHKYHNYLNKICIPIKEVPSASAQNARAAHELLGLSLS